MPCELSLNMPETSLPSSCTAAATPWTCPLCSLLCEGPAPQVAALGPAPWPAASPCPRADAGLRALHAGWAAPVTSLVDKQAVPAGTALQAAAQRLAHWRQALFAGLGTDIAGSRALYRLAARVGAITDHMDGEALMQAVRAVQDRGQYLCTLGELRSRATLVVCVGTSAIDHYPAFFRRAGLGEPDSPCRDLVFFGTPVPDGLPAGVASGLNTRHLPGSGDLAADLQQLAALVDGQPLRRSSPAHAALATLADELLAAPYAVLVWEAARLPAEGALLIEMLNRVVASLNRRTRAAAFGLGGNDGGFSVNQTLTWLSGLPLRTRVSRDGLQHEPRAYGCERLMAQDAVDGLLWISSFSPQRLPPATPLPRIVLGPPAMAAELTRAAALDNCIFIPVATPGVTTAGHLFRTDGPIVLPLFALPDLPPAQATLPSVAQVLSELDTLMGAMP